MNRPLGRRDFLRTTAAVTATAMTGSYLFAADEKKKPKLQEGRQVRHDAAQGQPPRDGSNWPRSAASLGVEIDSPGTANLDELVKASKETGVADPRRHRLGPLAATRFRSPDEKVRAKGLDALEGASRTPRPSGPTPCCSSPASCNKEVTYEQCWERSQAEVKKALPLAEKLEGEDRHRGGVEQLHHQAGATHRVR